MITYFNFKNEIKVCIFDGSPCIPSYAYFLRPELGSNEYEHLYQSVADVCAYGEIGQGGISNPVEYET